MISHFYARVDSIQGFPAKIFSYNYRWRWGRLLLSRMTMVYLPCWWMKCVLRLILITALPHQPSFGHSIYRPVLGKETWYSLVTLLVGVSMASPLLYLTCCDCVWSDMDTGFTSGAHSGLWTRCIWHAWYDRPSLVIWCVYAESECLPEICQIWKLIPNIFFTFVFNPNSSKTTIRISKSDCSQSSWFHSNKP